MGKFKHIITFILILAMSAALTGAAMADIAYEPEDSFYRKHFSGCEYENRSYYTNGEEGYVLVCSVPGGSSRTAIPNGGVYYVSYTYEEKGESWGCIEYDEATLENSGPWQENSTSGSVEMSQMKAEHDSAWFEEVYGEAIVSGTEKLEIGRDSHALGYKYPGSGIVVDEIGNYTNEEFITVDFSTLYTDAQGLKWGYLGYFFGHRNIWVCLSEPFEKLEAGEEYAEPELIPAAEPGALDEAQSEAERPLAYIVAGAASLIIIAAALCIVALRKKKRA